MHHYTYLALGDSYTIGEAVLLHQSFPYQAVQFLRKKGHQFLAPEIIAKTGWTTDELLNAMADYNFLHQYNFVSLLIGVNNQYRGRDVIEYKDEFEKLLQKAIGLAHNKTENVFVLSIPDYSTTPFASALDTEKIKNEIEVFNSVSKAVSIQYKVSYISISDLQNDELPGEFLLAADNLHPAASEYTKWAKKLSDKIGKQLK